MNSNVPSIAHYSSVLASRLAARSSFVVIICLTSLAIGVSVERLRREMSLSVSAVTVSLQRLAALGDRFQIEAEMGSLVTSGAIESFELTIQQGAQQHAAVRIAGQKKQENNATLGPLISRVFSIPLNPSGVITLVTTRRFVWSPLWIALLLAALLSASFMLLTKRSFRLLTAAIAKPILELTELLCHTSTGREISMESLRSKPAFREVSQLLEEFEKRRIREKHLEEMRLIQAQSDAQAQIAAQVVHDIRSPTMLLNILAETEGMLGPEEKKLLKEASQRIEDICRDLHSTKKTMCSKQVTVPSSDIRFATNQSAETQSLGEILEGIVEEKKREFITRPNLSLELKATLAAHNFCTELPKTTICRVVSNLINNAFEATEGEQKIILHADLVHTDHLNSEVCSHATAVSFGEIAPSTMLLVLSVEDQGLGIPLHVIEKLGAAGVTFGKRGGSGLGIAHAIATARSIKGRLDIKTTQGTGTVVRLVLPADRDSF